MPIDTSIYGQLRPIQIDSPLEAQAKVDQFRAGQMQNRLAELALGSKQREVEQENALSELYKTSVGADGKVDRQKLLTGAAQGGLGNRIPGLQKTFSEQDKSMREAEKERIASAKAQIELIGQVAGAANDPQSYASGLQMLQQAGVDISQIPTEYNPQYVAQARMQALDASKQLDQHWKRLGFDQDERKFAYQQQNDAQNRQVTVRGQNLTDARARERLAFDQSQPKGQVVQTDNGPVLVDPRTGQGRPVTLDGKPVGSKDSGGTEGEKNAAGYGLRMAEAEKIIGSVSAKDPKAQKPGVIESVAGNNAVTNALSSTNRQQYRQAQEDWVRAKLRKESGAVIGEEEMSREIATYFPQPGDKPEVISQKAQARRVAMDAMKTSAGKAGKNIGAGGSNIDDLLKKYGG